jgi:hypothetical protein
MVDPVIDQLDTDIEFAEAVTEALIDAKRPFIESLVWGRRYHGLCQLRLDLTGFDPRV